MEEGGERKPILYTEAEEKSLEPMASCLGMGRWTRAREVILRGKTSPVLGPAGRSGKPDYSGRIPSKKQNRAVRSVRVRQGKIRIS